MDTRTTHGSFSWNELMAPNVNAAADFYKKLCGWTPVAAPVPGIDYTLFKNADGIPVAGLMASKPGAPTAWTAYITVDNVDQSLELALSLGAKVCCPCTDIPGVGRFALFADPQGAVIGIITYIPCSEK